MCHMLATYIENESVNKTRDYHNSDLNLLVKGGSLKFVALIVVSTAMECSSIKHIFYRGFSYSVIIVASSRGRF